MSGHPPLRSTSTWPAFVAMGLCVQLCLAQPASRPWDPRSEPSIYPHEGILCGPVALYLVCRSYGIDTYSANDIAKMASWGPQGVSMAGLQEACNQIGLASAVVRLDTDKLAAALKDGQQRAIIPVDQTHYAYVDRVEDHRFRITPYPRPPRWYTPEQMRQAWDGPALLVSREPVPTTLPATLDSPGLAAPSETCARHARRIVGLGLLAAGLLWGAHLVRRSRRGRPAPIN